MSADISKMSIAELDTLIADASAERARAKEENRADAIKAVAELAAEYGFTIMELARKPRTPKAAKAVKNGKPEIVRPKRHQSQASA